MSTCPRCGTSYDGDARFCPDDASPLVEDDDLARIGGTIGNYAVAEVLGRGGMGTVFRAEHVYIGKPVAVKVLHRRFAENQEAVQRFLREARAASAIAHPNIVDITDFGRTDDGCVYIVMEFVEGASLEAVIDRDGPIPLLRAINIVNQIASALAAAHEKGIIHRDLKPENIMLTRRPGRRELVRAEPRSDGARELVVEPEHEFDFVKILDFGIAKVLEPELLDEDALTRTGEGILIGTPQYMAPEAARGQLVDHRSDIYALGILFYDLLTRRVPFEGATPMETLAKHIAEPPLPPRQAAPEAEITEAAEALILRALAKDPADRQQSMDELRTELQGCYGRVVYRRDVDRVPGARELGLAPRPRALTEELGEWLAENREQLEAAERRMAELIRRRDDGE